MKTNPFDRIGYSGPACLLVAASIGSWGCKTKQTITTTQVHHPIIEKFASNFDTSQGVATSEENSTYDAIGFEGTKAFEGKDIDLKKFDGRAFDDVRDYKGTREIEGHREFAGTKDHSFTDKEAFGDEAESAFSEREAVEMETDKNKSGFFSRMFGTKDLSETDKKYAIPEKPMFSGATDPDMNAPVVGNQPDPVTEDDIRKMLNRSR